MVAVAVVVQIDQHADTQSSQLILQLLQIFRLMANGKDTLTRADFRLFVEKQLGQANIRKQSTEAFAKDASGGYLVPSKHLIT